MFYNYRYSVIGINSFNSNPDVFTKVTPDLRNWIVSLVLLQSAGTCRDLVKPLAKARLRNERNVEEVFYFHTSKYIK